MNRRHLIHHGLAGGVATAAAALFGNSQSSTPVRKGAAETGGKGLSPRSGDPYPVGVEIGDSGICVAVGERLHVGAVKLLGTSHRALEFPDRLLKDNEYEKIIADCLGAALAEAEANSGIWIQKVGLALSIERMPDIPSRDFRQAVIEVTLAEKEMESGRLWTEHSHLISEWRGVPHLQRGGRGWMKAERHWRNNIWPDPKRKEPYFVCGSDGLIQRYRPQDVPIGHEAIRDSCLEGWVKMQENCLRKHGVGLDCLVDSAAACGEALLPAEAKQKGAVTLQVENGSNDPRLVCAISLLKFM